MNEKCCYIWCNEFESSLKNIKFTNTHFYLLSQTVGSQNGLWNTFVCHFMSYHNQENQDIMRYTRNNGKEKDAYLIEIKIAFQRT